MAAPLLLDALERVIANPTASQRWHTLLDHHEAARDREARGAVRASLLDQVPDDGIAGFFRATFLAWVTGEAHFVARAGHLVQTIRPIDCERLMAFAAFEWGRALVGGGGRGGFVARLRGAGLPEVVGLAGAHLGRSAGLAPRRVDRVRRVALVASFIGPQGHAPSGLALQHARILCEHGLEVQMFSGQELLMPDMPQYLGHNGRAQVAPPDMAALAELVPSGVRLTLGDPQFSLMRRWQRVMAGVTAFDPDLVLFVGLHSPMVEVLYPVRPVLGLCVHSVAPMASVDVWLAADPALAGRWDAAWGASFPPAWAHGHPYRVALKPVGGPVTRAALGLAPDSVVLVTVGARLCDEITGDWAARMAGLLQRHPQTVWVLAGGDGTRPAALGAVEPNRMRVLPHREDVRSVLRGCDVYVNPPRLGGGFSVAEAMAEGLAVVALADADGGNKIGGFAVNGIEAYFSRLEALIEQPGLREQTGRALQELFSTTLDLARSGPSLLAACELSVDGFRRRTAASGA